jgi:hypothetical protein
MTAASPVRTGGSGRRTARQRALSLPTEKGPLTSLACEVSPSRLQCLLCKVRTNDACIGWSVIGLQGNLNLPWRKTGEPQSGDGACSNTPPPAFCWRPSLCTRETCEEGEGKRRVGKREPNAMPAVLPGVGWGLGVGAQESWAHQDADGGRRPLAGGKPGAKGPSARASGPWVDSWGAGEMRRNASWCGLTTEQDRRC